MKHLLLFLTAITSCAAPVVARDVPFEAVVNTGEAVVRSGPGEKDYYPTQKLKQGTRVRVIRENYGGWYMIEPPEGSHSWIRAEFVKRRGNNRGIISENTVDRIGSSLNRSNLTVIHKVAEGEVVTILGQATMRSGQKPVEMLKIAPPRGEYRYINRKDVVPADEYSSQPDLLASSQADRSATSGRNQASTESEIATGPFGKPIAGSPASGQSGSGTTPALGDQSFDMNKSLADSGNGSGSSSSKGFQTLNQLPGSAGQGISTPGTHFEAPQALGTTPQSPEEQVVIEQAWQNVMQTDSRFRRMLKQPVSQWNLASLKQVYQESAAQMTSPSLKRQIENRIGAVNRYQKLYQDQIAIEQILAQTESRDAQIRQSYSAKWHSVSTTNPPTTRILKPGNTPTVSPTPVAPSPISPTRATGTPSAAAAPRKIVGAGIVQRSALSRPGIPAYVLLAPDGRVLSYLQAGPGINLDSHIGKSVGITGARSFRRELNADLMIVRGLSPVNLKP